MMTIRRILPLLSLTAAAAAHLGGGLTGVSWGAQRIDIFGTDSKDDVFHKYFTAFGWGPQDPAHGDLELFTKASASSEVSVASWGANRLDFVFVDKEGNARHKYWDGSSWGPNGNDGFDLLGKGVEGKLAITSWGPDRFDVVGHSADRSYDHKAWTGKEYYPPGQAWESLGGDFSSPPSTVSWGPGRLDIFGITAKGKVSHKFWDGYQWQGWEDLGGHNFTGRLWTSSPYINRFDIWAVSTSGHLHHKFWDGFAYHEWEDLGGSFASAPQVVHWSESRVDILGKSSTKDEYLYKYYDGYSWSKWESKGADWHSEPALVSIGEGNLNLFGVDKAGKLKLQVWDGSQWLPGFKDWYVLGDTKVGGEKSVLGEVVGGEEVVLGEDRSVRIELKFRA